MVIGLYLILTALIASALLSNRNKKVNYILVTLFVVVQWIFTVFQFYYVNQSQLEYFTADAIGLLLLTVLSLLNTTSAYYSFIYLEKRGDTAKQRSSYFVAYVVLIASITCAYLADHVAIAWIFVELTTLSSSVLIYHRRTERTLEATWKYIFICSISVALIFMGILLLGLAVQQAKTGDLYYSNMMKNAVKLDEFWLKSAFLFIFTGYTVKAGLVPMYTAGIDAKDKAPSPAAAIFSSALMNVGFIGIFRMYAVVSKTNIVGWANTVMIISAISSIFIAAAYMIRVKSYKRMFAYSSIEHMGIVMLGLSMTGIGYFGAVLHVILHSFTKAALFYQFGSVFRILKSKFIKETGGYFEKNISGALVLLLGFFMITAVPPSGMFVSEFMIFSSLFAKGYLWIIVVFGILLTVILWSFGENIFKLLFQKTSGEKEIKEPVEKISPMEAAPQFILLFLVVYLGFFPPDAMVNLINEAIKLIH